MGRTPAARCSTYPRIAPCILVAGQTFCARRGFKIRRSTSTTFYDLAKDPLERNNLAAHLGDKELHRRRSELLEWHAETTAAYDRPSHS